MQFSRLPKCSFGIHLVLEYWLYKLISVFRNPKTSRKEVFNHLPQNEYLKVSAQKTQKILSHTKQSFLNTIIKDIAVPWQNPKNKKKQYKYLALHSKCLIIGVIITAYAIRERCQPHCNVIIVLMVVHDANILVFYTDYCGCFVRI